MDIGLLPQIAGSEVLDPLNNRRANNIDFANTQRITEQLQDRIGGGAATARRRMNLASATSLLFAILAGAGAGAAIHYSGDNDSKFDLGKNIITGGVLGLGAGVVGRLLGRLAGNLVHDEEYAEGYKHVSPTTYLLPGASEYYNTQLGKDLEEAEVDKPQQLVF